MIRKNKCRPFSFPKNEMFIKESTFIFCYHSILEPNPYLQQHSSLIMDVWDQFIRNSINMFIDKNKERTFKIHKKHCNILFSWSNHITDQFSEFGESCILVINSCFLADSNTQMAPIIWEKHAC